MNKGFTLIELIVVIAILSLLGSVILASFNSAKKVVAEKESKKEATCSELGEVKVADLPVRCYEWYGINKI